MNFYTKVLLGLGAACALVGAYYLDDVITKKHDEEQKRLSLALSFQPDEILKLSFQNKNTRIVFTRPTPQSAWVTESPKNLALDQPSITNTLFSISEIRIQQEIPDTEDAVKQWINHIVKSPGLASTPTDMFGFEQPQMAFSVTAIKNKEHTLQVGTDVQIGGSASGQTSYLAVYGRSTQRRRLLTLDAAYIRTLESRTLSDFRAKEVALFDPTAVESISILSHKNPTIMLKKVALPAASAQAPKPNGTPATEWELVQPKHRPVAMARVQEFLEKYRTLRATRIIEKADAIRAGLDKYDLSQPAAVIRMFGKNGKALLQISLGITKEGLYVTMPDRSIGALPLSEWAECVPKESQFPSPEALKLQKEKQEKANKTALTKKPVL